MQDFLYSQSSVSIALALLVLMLMSLHVGRWLGRQRNGAQPSEQFVTHVNQIQGSLLGILALMLGFSFSLALQRYDTRSEAVVLEANAIGTALLRSAMLPGNTSVLMRSEFSRYIDLRVAASEIPLDEQERHEALLQQAVGVQQAMWSLAMQTASTDPNPVTTGLFIQALNTAIDAFGVRVAELQRHVPEIVSLMLYSTFLLAGGVIGYSSALSGHRLSGPAYILVVLFVALTFIIVDLDHPRRGFVIVDHTPLLALQADIHAQTP